MKDTKISIFRDLFSTKDVPYIVTLESVVNRIREGRHKDLIERIRKEQVKERRDELKRKLPCIIFSGEFSERNKSGLISHSGLCVMDYDGFEDELSLKIQFEILKKNPHFVTLFISPSGNGIKGVIHIPKCDKYDHERYFKEFQKKYEYPNFDRANCNIDRVCWESYDPNIYTNYSAELFSPQIKDEGYSVKDRTPVIPLTDDMAIMDRIMKWSWSKDFQPGQRNVFIFDLAGAFCEYGVSRESAEGYIISNVIHGDFKESEARTSIRSAYKVRQAGSKYFEDTIKLKAIKADLPAGKEVVLSKHGISEETYDEIKIIEDSNEFWTYDKKRTIRIDQYRFKKFIESCGFRKYFPNGAQKPQFIQVDSNKVEITSEAKIKDHVLTYLEGINKNDVWNHVAERPQMFTEQALLMLETIELTTLRDTPHESYIAFNNGILKVKKDSISLMEYVDIDAYIWRGQIVQRDFKQHKIENDYQKFIANIAGGDTKPIECVIGYLLHTYKNRMHNKAIIMNDEIISENPEGGTGKGLFIQGIKQIRRVSIIDGKSFDNSKSFAFQTVNPETQVLVFDDVKKTFNFEDNFSIVTEGLTIERKNKDAIRLSVTESPKLVLTTNYAIKGSGFSDERRRHEIELSQYYGRAKTPFDEFGREIFTDWTADDFLSFDNYMVKCLQLYMMDGLLPQSAKNVKLRKLIAETSHEFYEWISDTENFTLNTRHVKIATYNTFISHNKDYAKLKMKTFTTWVQKYASFIGVNYVDGGRGDDRWYCIGEADNAHKVPF